MQKYSILIALFIIISLSSCSKSLTSFTDQLYKQQRWSDTELKRIQFYLSDDIVLRRDAGTTKSRLDEGQIQIIDGRRVEQVVFRKGTPGVFVFSPSKDKFAISFEDNSDKYLMFGPSDKWSGRYVLLAKEWKKNRGKISYDGKVWNTSSESAYTALQVDLKKASNTQYKSKSVKGRKIR